MAIMVVFPTRCFFTITAWASARESFRLCVQSRQQRDALEIYDLAKAEEERAGELGEERQPFPALLSALPNVEM